MFANAFLIPHFYLPPRFNDGLRVKEPHCRVLLDSSATFEFRERVQGIINFSAIVPTVELGKKMLVLTWNTAHADGVMRRLGFLETLDFGELDFSLCLICYFSQSYMHCDGWRLCAVKRIQMNMTT